MASGSRNNFVGSDAREHPPNRRAADKKRDRDATDGDCGAETATGKGEPRAKGGGAGESAAGGSLFRGAEVDAGNAAYDDAGPQPGVASQIADSGDFMAWPGAHRWRRVRVSAGAEGAMHRGCAAWMDAIYGRQLPV